RGELCEQRVSRNAWIEAAGGDLSQDLRIFYHIESFPYRRPTGFVGSNTNEEQKESSSQTQEYKNINGNLNQRQDKTRPQAPFGPGACS
ncbi:hypothetical protein AVEN_105149-1, partial [Araneus ventricosus]